MARKKTMINSLQDKRILIVGGSSGIGLAVAIQAYKAGGKVIIASRNAVNKHNNLAALVGAVEISDQEHIHLLMIPRWKMFLWVCMRILSAS